MQSKHKGKQNESKEKHFFLTHWLPLTSKDAANFCKKKTNKKTGGEMKEKSCLCMFSEFYAKQFQTNFSILYSISKVCPAKCHLTRHTVPLCNKQPKDAYLQKI